MIECLLILNAIVTLLLTYTTILSFKRISNLSKEEDKAVEICSWHHISEELNIPYTTILNWRNNDFFKGCFEGSKERFQDVYKEKAIKRIFEDPKKKAVDRLGTHGKTLRECANEFNINHHTLREWLKDDSLRKQVITGIGKNRTFLVDSDKLKAWILENKKEYQCNASQ